MKYLGGANLYFQDFLFFAFEMTGFCSQE
jgi:hypothetical protein